MDDLINLKGLNVQEGYDMFINGNLKDVFLNENYYYMDSNYSNRYFLDILIKSIIRIFIINGAVINFNTFFSNFEYLDKNYYEKDYKTLSIKTNAVILNFILENSDIITNDDFNRQSQDLLSNILWGHNMPKDIQNIIISNYTYIETLINKYAIKYGGWINISATDYKISGTGKFNNEYVFGKYSLDKYLAILQTYKFNSQYLRYKFHNVNDGRIISE